ncbi:MAG: isochorismatase family protein [Dethiobacter sp.]|nr:MAG: isochorismatase family protein [Dethiobacter sp.]
MKEVKLDLINLILVAVLLIINLQNNMPIRVQNYYNPLIKQGNNITLFQKENNIQEIRQFSPILNDYPEFVSPVNPGRRFLGNPLVSDNNATLAVKAWYFSYHAGGVVEATNLLNKDKTAIIMVYPHSTNNWDSGFFFGTQEKNDIYIEHAKTVLKPFLDHFNSKVRLVGYSLPDGLMMIETAETANNKINLYNIRDYHKFKRYLQLEGIEHVLLCGYATDICLKETMAGYANLRKDFNVFIVGDATLATFPASESPAGPTGMALANASLENLITQVSWIQEIE